MKNFSKVIAKQCAALLVLPSVALVRLCSRLGDERKAFRAMSELFSLFPGVSGQYLRRAFLRGTILECADDCLIGFGTLFSTRRCSIGTHVYIGSQCSIGSAHIGKDCLLASGVRLLSGLHQHGTKDVDRPIRLQPGRFETIEVGENCWIGEGAIVAANVGAHSIVAAGSVVFSEVPPYSVVQGNPACVIRSRKPDTVTPLSSEKEGR